MSIGSLQMVDKRNYLANVVKAILDDFNIGDFNVDSYMREAVLRSLDRKARLSIMSPDYDPDDPVSSSETRYVRISETSPIEEGGIPGTGAESAIDGRMSLMGSLMQVSHSFRILLYYQYSDASSYLESSQYNWDRLTEKDDGDDPMGILPYFREVSSFDTSPATLVSPPQEVVKPTFPIALLGGEGDYVHYLEFTVVLT